MSNINSEIIYVYLTTNLLTGMQYIGMHRTKKKNDNYFGSGIKIGRAIKKYGKKNFKRDILEICDSVANAHNKEAYFIKVYNTLHPFGYNISPTGGCLGKESVSDETRAKMSASAKRAFANGERSIWSKGLTMSDPKLAYVVKKMREGANSDLKRKENLSIAHKKISKYKRRNRLGQFAEKEPVTGVGMPIESRNKLSNSLMGNKNWAKRSPLTIEQKGEKSYPVSQYDLNNNLIKRWSSVSLAAYTLGFKRKGINNASYRGHRYAGFLWKADAKRITYKYCQYDLNGYLIKTWDSLKDIFNALNIKPAAINYNLRGETKTAGGYKWGKREAECHE